MLAEYKKAKAKGNSKRVEELKAWGEVQQVLLHKQAFSTAPVDDILAHISDQLPAIKMKGSSIFKGVPHFFGKVFHGKGLLNKMDPFIQDAAMGNDIRRIAGHV